MCIHVCGGGDVMVLMWGWGVMMSVHVCVTIRCKLKLSVCMNIQRIQHMLYYVLKCIMSQLTSVEPYMSHVTSLDYLGVPSN